MTRILKYHAASSVLIFACLAPFPHAFAATSPSAGDMARQTHLAVNRLQQWYDPKSGLWKQTGWWNSANVLTVLVDFSRVTGTTEYDGVIARTYAANVKSGFINGYYDDEGWWALAWIDAYDLTGKRPYLNTAASIFGDMTSGWDQTCGGGLWWSRKRRYKNAVANELFLSVAAHLANRTGNVSERNNDLDWAVREWTWFRHVGMMEHDHLISDGLNAQCSDNHGRKWSYNQGVILGGLAELSRQPGQRGLLRYASRIADAAIHGLTDQNGILHDACEPRCGSDGTQFKGIFMRNLAVLYRQRPRVAWKRFIFRNADSILAHDQAADHSFGVIWSGPPAAADPSTQSSALDALVAAIQIEHEGGTR
jgi:predicted alpha-1,6-mannanase (GH76 family)